MGMKNVGLVGVLCAMLSLIGCGDDAAKPISFDATVDARQDSGSGDAALDASGDATIDAAQVDASLDASVDSAMDAMMDTSVDSSMMDGGMLDGGSPIEDGGEGPPPGEFVSPCPDEDDDEFDLPSCGDDCPAGSFCVAGLCGGQQCVRGVSCGNNADCNGTTCSEIEPGGPSSCGVTSLDACTTRRDCPMGYECESNTCVSRYLSCSSIIETGCPQGYSCGDSAASSVTSEGTSEDHCRRIFLTCASDSQCDSDEECVDIDNDGQKECYLTAGPTCASNADCAGEAGTGCSVLPDIRSRACTPYFLCHSNEDCAGDWVCLDAAEDGQGLCVPSGGDCTKNRDCASPGICASPIWDAPPTCIGTPSQLMPPA